MHLAGWDGAARVRSPRLLQSALQCLCGLGGNRSGLLGRSNRLHSVGQWISASVAISRDPPWEIHVCVSS